MGFVVAVSLIVWGINRMPRRTPQPCNLTTCLCYCECPPRDYDVLDDSLENP